MKNKVWILSKVFLKTSFSSGFNMGKKEMLKSILMLILIIFSVGSLVWPIGLLVSVMFDGFKSIGQEGALLAFVLSICSFFIFIMGIVYVLTVYYFSSDVENLLPLPLKPYQIVGAKFVTVLVYEYLTEVVFLGPAFIVYGVKSSSGILFYIYAIIIFLTLPIIPLIMGSLIDMVVMRFTNIGKHKDKLRVLGAMVALFAGIGINMFIQKQTTTITSQEQLINLISSGNNSLVEVMSGIFPFAKFAALSMTAAHSLKGLQYLGIFLVINIAFIAVFILFSETLYFKGVIGGSESYSKRKKISNTELEKQVIERSKLVSWTIKELRVLFRTPAYFINCVIMNFLWPAFIVFPLLSQGAINQDMGMIRALAAQTQFHGLIIAGTFGMSLFVAVTNAIASTSISREGQNIAISKYVPVSFKDQLLAKLLSSLILGGAGLLLVIFTVAILTRIPLYIMIGMLLVAFIALLFTSLTGIFIDLKYPKLNWDNEQKAVKQNFNVLINMLIGLLVGMTIVISTTVFELSFIVVTGTIILIFGLVNAFLFRKLVTTGAEIFSKIEV